MKVHELISLLAAYPPNAKVDINVPPEPHMGDWQDREIEAVGTAEQLVSIEPTPGWNLIISESTLDVATSEASGECKHGINRGDSCFECDMEHSEAEHRALMAPSIKKAWATSTWRGSRESLTANLAEAILEGHSADEWADHLERGGDWTKGDLFSIVYWVWHNSIDWVATKTLEERAREAIAKHLDLRLANVAAWCANELLQDWPDPEGIRNMANERFYAGFDDELLNSPANIPDEVREYHDAWDVFLDLAMKRAEESVRATRGYTEKV